MTLKPTSTHTFAIQRNQEMRLLGAAIFLPPEVIEPFVAGGNIEKITYNLKPVPEGVLIEIGGGYNE